MKKALKYLMLVPAMATVAMAAQAGDNLNRGAASAGSSFAFGLFQDAVSYDGSDVVFISPLSASMALSMTANGAEEATLDEMLSVLGQDASIKDLNEYNRSVMDFLASGPVGIELNVANSIWVSDLFPVRSRFCKTAVRYYDALVSNLDFSDPASPSVINSWCSENTNGRIGKMIESIDPATQMYLLNALYFKGMWSCPFDAARTREDIFHGNNRDSKVEFMHNTADFAYYTGPEGSVLELPYGNGSFVMDIFLPAEGTSAEEFVSGLDSETLSTLTGLLQTDRIKVTIPKFKAEYETSLIATLQRLGMRTAFTPAADFSGIAREPLMISEVKQKTFIEVNEKGSEAAAVTSVGIMRTSLAPDPFEFKADRPFVFLIRGRESGPVLFMGIVRNL